MKRTPMSGLNTRAPQQLPQQVNINEADTLETKCMACGGELFNVAYRLRTFPALSPKNPTGKDQLIKMEVYMCQACGHEFGKPFLKDGKE